MNSLSEGFILRVADVDTEQSPVAVCSEPGGVELFFSILSRRLLRYGEFESRDDLVAKIVRFVEAHNRTARPFAWTDNANPLKIA